MKVKQFFEIFRNELGDTIDPCDGCLWIYIMRNGQWYLARRTNARDYDEHRILKIIPFADTDNDISFDIYIDGEDYEE